MDEVQKNFFTILLSEFETLVAVRTWFFEGYEKVPILNEKSHRIWFLGERVFFFISIH